MIQSVDTVTAVNFYPTKGCRPALIEGAAPDSLQIGETGFEVQDVRDREFVVVEAAPLAENPATHLFVSQRGWDTAGRPVKGRHDNVLATVETNIAGGKFQLAAKGIGELSLAAAYDPAAEHAPGRYNVQVHSGLLPEAIDQGDEAADFYSTLLGRSVRLARANRSAPRLLPFEHTRADATNKVAGADGYPFLIVSQASLDAAHDMNDMSRGTVPLSQYRGNVEIDGVASGAWGEDFIRKARVGSTIMYFVKPSARCIVTNLDQQSGERTMKGLRVLRGHGGYIDDPSEPEVFFGQNANHVFDPENVSTIAVGDTLRPLELSTMPNFNAAA